MTSLKLYVLDLSSVAGTSGRIRNTILDFLNSLFRPFGMYVSDVMVCRVVVIPS